MTKLERALQYEQEEFNSTPNRERIDVILDPKRLMATTCPRYYGMLDYNCSFSNCTEYHKCEEDWLEEV